MQTVSAAQMMAHFSKAVIFKHFPVCRTLEDKQNFVCMHFFVDITSFKLELPVRIKLRLKLVDAGLAAVFVNSAAFIFFPFVFVPHVSFYTTFNYFCRNYMVRY